MIDLSLQQILKRERQVSSFAMDGGKWFFLIKQTGDFLALKTLRDRFGGVNAMKNFLGIVETPPALERSFKAAAKLRCEFPTDIEM